MTNYAGHNEANYAERSEASYSEQSEANYHSSIPVGHKLLSIINKSYLCKKISYDKEEEKTGKDFEEACRAGERNIQG